MSTDVSFSVFTKPWRCGIDELGAKIAALGFDAIELPVRPGYPVHPDNVAAELPRAVQQLAAHGLKIASIAGPTDEKTIAACADAGVPIIRICVGIGSDGYMASEARLRREYDALAPLLAHYGVTLGVQNHNGRYICNAMGLRHLLEGFDPKQIAAVWDAAHNALDGEEPEMALDIVWPHLCMVNLKNAFRRRRNGPEAPAAEWEVFWTTGPHGFASWPRVAAELQRRSYYGVVCLTAEYTDEHAVDRLIATDIAYARALFSAI
jgi:sugar phosphate isomerase/epimerase